MYLFASLLALNTRVTLSFVKKVNLISRLVNICIYFRPSCVVYLGGAVVVLVDLLT